MKKSLSLGFLLCLAFPETHAQSLKIDTGPSGLQLKWRHTFPPNPGVPTWKEFRILSSQDLSQWTEDSFIRVDDTEGDGWSFFDLNQTQEQRYFRLQEKLVYSHRGSDSDQPAFYERQYLNSRNATLSLSQFATKHTHPGIANGISWDPTTACFFEEFNTTPEEHNAGLEPDDPERRIYDFTLNQEEAALFQQNGFVVSPQVRAFLRLEDGTLVGPPQIAPTCVDLYYALWTDDLPVFITADSVLDAWHQTFASMLEEIDETAIYPAIKQLVKYDLVPAFTATVDSWDDSSASPEAIAEFQQAIEDVTFYLDMARAFLDTTPPSSSATALEWYNDLIDPDPSQLRKFGPFGDGARISRPNLYKVRGRYTRSGVLSAHFRTLVWLSRAQFHIAHSTELDREQRDRELRAAILLALSLRNGGLIDDWRTIETMLQGIAGQSDAMTIPEMVKLLEDLSLDSVSTIASPAALASVRDALIASNYGIQEIDGGYFEPDSVDPQFNICNPDAIEQPRALSLFGQRWSPDAWTFQKVVFPEVRRDGVAVPRRLPSGIDVAFSTLGNDTAAPILLERMENTEGVPFRDGYDIHQNLSAVRQTLDSQEEAFWTEHLYGQWLHSLRALSKPLSSQAPDTFRTSAWNRRILNTQLASWTQLRHDTLLFVKQSFTPPILCEFPDGYVDPYPELWERLSDIALTYRDFIGNFEFAGTMWLEQSFFGGDPLPTDVFSPATGYDPNAFPARTREVDLESRLTAMTDHLENFSAKCLILKGVAEHQLAGLPHTQAMKSFLSNTVEDFEVVSYASERRYSGWFPALYFENVRNDGNDAHPSSLWNPVVVDVHTDAADTMCYFDPGAILHQGTGRVQFMLTAVKHPDGSTCTYGGPVMSHYEFTTPLGTRLSDEEWKSQLELGTEPVFNSWKHDFLVPAASE